MRETYIVRQIDQLLWHLGVWHYRTNTGAFRGNYTYKKGPLAGVTHERFMRYGIPGQPDFIAIIAGRFVGIEVKNEKGKQSPAQQNFQQEIEANGGLYILVRSAEECQEKIKGLKEILL